MVECFSLTIILMSSKVDRTDCCCVAGLGSKADFRLWVVG